jgi:4a-hydroxytetrahydrobiopterin dehydratase
MEKLNEESIQGWLESHSGWRREGDVLVKDFGFPSFRNAIVFVNRVASLADDMNHHPDIDIRHTNVRLAMTTHDADGLTDKDLQLAQQVDHATSAR